MPTVAQMVTSLNATHRSSGNADENIWNWEVVQGNHKEWWGLWKLERTVPSWGKTTLLSLVLGFQVWSLTAPSVPGNLVDAATQVPLCAWINILGMKISSLCLMWLRDSDAAQVWDPLPVQDHVAILFILCSNARNFLFMKSSTFKCDKWFKIIKFTWWANSVLTQILQLPVYPFLLILKLQYSHTTLLWDCSIHQWAYLQPHGQKVVSHDLDMNVPLRGLSITKFKSLLPAASTFPSISGCSLR